MRFTKNAVTAAAAIVLAFPGPAETARAQSGGGQSLAEEPEDTTAAETEETTTSSFETEPIAVEWDRRQNVEERLRSYGPDILGDAIDPHTGAITFEHTDVSLPGNSDLEVAVRRKRSQGMIYHENEAVEFGDWELMVPRIHALSGNGAWTGARCSNSYATSFPVKTAGSQFGGGTLFFYNHQYSEGVVMDVPGAGAMQVLESKQGAFWPSAATHVTVEGWYLTCTSASDGGQGFIAHAPNGDVYEFDEYISAQAKSLGAWGGQQLPRTRNILAASQVTDVHGNWVKYDYDASGRLTRIHSNDGREITLSYSGSSKLISQVTANGRTWDYSYAQSTYSETYEIGYTTGGGQVLRTVTQPDGRSWTFQLDDMTARAGPGTQCWQQARTLTVTHPYGTTGVFELAEKEHRQSYNALAEVTYHCPNDAEIVNNSDPPPTFNVTRFETMSVTSKTLSGPNFPNATWTYNYESDQGAAGTSGGNRTNWTKVTDPTGAEITYYHLWNAEPLGGKLDKREVRDVAHGGALLETTTHDYLLENLVGNTFTRAGPTPVTSVQPSRAYEDRIGRLGDWYKTRYDYVTDFTASNYSFGFPTKTWRWSSTSGDWAGRRTTFTDYAHRKSVWVLGLPTKVTHNGKVFQEHGYDSAGRRLWTDRLGVRDRDYTYHTTGAQAGLVHTATDSRSRMTTLSNYKRGEPQTIVRPDNVGVYATVDDNGRLTSVTNGRGYTTWYDYNSVGWLTLIDRPAPHADTTIDYVNVGGSGFYQRNMRGAVEEKIWYDGMFRPHRTGRAPLSGGGLSVYTASEYDVHGRVTFQSQPRTSFTPTAGIDTVYDALGRVVSTSETVYPYAQTTTEYLSGARTRTTDAENNVTTVTRQGYGSPDDGGVVKIEQPTDVTTEIARDVYGNMTSARQHGAHNGYAVDQTQYYYYDWRLRLCRHSVPETGDTLYRHNVASELVREGRGQPAGTGCAEPPAADTINRSYDDLGRLTFVNYGDGTPDIDIDYDANGNVVSNVRGGAAWTYSYDELDQLEAETLVIDNRTYATTYNLNAIGALVSQLTPAGRTISFDPNGLGQATGARLGAAVRAENAVYHPNGVLEELTYGNGLSLTQGLNARQLVSSIKVQDGANTPVRFAYAHDGNGRIVSIDDLALAGQDRDFAYDGLGRLAGASGPWGAGSYDYDSLGNLRRKTLGARVVDIQYNGKNQVDRARDTADGSVWRTYVHDARGNVADNGRLAFTYDVANQPTAVSGSGVSGSFEYDGNFKRVKQTLAGETVYSVYSQTGALLYRDNATTGETTDYIRVADKTIARIKGASTHYLHQDHLGSPVAATTTGAAVSWREDYAPFGEERQNPAANDNDESFTGHVRDDETGLVYMQARYMDPVIGRFLSNDPVPFSPDQPQMFNRYSYVLNDPVNATDPDGRAMSPAERRGSFGPVQNRIAPGVLAIGFTYSRTVTDNRGRRSVVQGTVGGAIGFSDSKFGATLFSSAEYGVGLEKGPGAFFGFYDGEPENFEGAFSTTGGQGLWGLFGGSITVADEFSGGQFNFGRPGGSSTVGYTKTFNSIGNAFNSAQDKVGATFSNESVSYSANGDGSVTATISSTGSRITREVTCTEDGCK